MLTTEHAKTLGLLARAIAVQQQPHDKMPEKKTPAPVAEMEVVVEAKQAEVDPTSVQVTTEVVAPFMVETLAVVPAPAAFEAPPTTEFVETIEAPAPPTPQAPLTAEAPQSLPPLPPSSPAEENTQNKVRTCYENNFFILFLLCRWRLSSILCLHFRLWCSLQAATSRISKTAPSPSLAVTPNVPGIYEFQFVFIVFFFFLDVI